MVLQGKYEAMYQGPQLDAFGRVSTKLSPPAVDPLERVAMLQNSGVTIQIEDQMNPQISVSVHKLFDVLILLLSKQNKFRPKSENYNTTVEIALNDYMALCGVPATKSSKDEARSNIKKDLELLSQITITWRPTVAAREKSNIPQYGNMKLFTWSEIKRGIIRVDFTTDLTAYLTHAFVTWFPMNLLRLDGKNSNAYYIGKKMAYHYGLRQNVKRGVNSCISVASLLSSTPDIQCQNIMEQDSGHWSRRIRTPFEKALDALQDVGAIDRWSYCYGKKEPIQNLVTETSSFLRFSKLYITFFITDFPLPGQQMKSV